MKVQDKILHCCFYLVKNVWPKRRYLLGRLGCKTLQSIIDWGDPPRPTFHPNQLPVAGFSTNNTSALFNKY
jgi:hypothetical protein